MCACARTRDYFCSCFSSLERERERERFFSVRETVESQILYCDAGLSLKLRAVISSGESLGSETRRFRDLLQRNGISARCYACCKDNIYRLYSQVFCRCGFDILI